MGVDGAQAAVRLAKSEALEGMLQERTHWAKEKITPPTCGRAERRYGLLVEHSTPPHGRFSLQTLELINDPEGTGQVLGEFVRARVHWQAYHTSAVALTGSQEFQSGSLPGASWETVLVKFPGEIDRRGKEAVTLGEDRNGLVLIPSQDETLFVVCEPLPGTKNEFIPRRVTKLGRGKYGNVAKALRGMFSMAESKFRSGA